MEWPVCFRRTNGLCTKTISPFSCTAKLGAKELSDNPPKPVRQEVHS